MYAENLKYLAEGMKNLPVNLQNLFIDLTKNGLVENDI